MSGPEATVQRELVHCLEHLGFFVSKFDQGYRQDGSTRQTPGIPDLYALHAGQEMSVWVEVKAGSNTPTPHQEAWHEEARAAGENVVVAWCVDDLISGLQDAGFPIG